MPKSLILLVLLFGATPALGQSTSPPRLPRQLTDPREADRVVDTMQVVSQAVLNMKVGAVEAAVEGRDPTPAEENLTVRDVGRRHDPDFDRKLGRQIAQVRPTIERGMKALNVAIPAMMKALDDASRAIDRAAANMPDPTYPRR